MNPHFWLRCGVRATDNDSDLGRSCVPQSVARGSTDKYSRSRSRGRRGSTDNDSDLGHRCVHQSVARGSTDCDRDLGHRRVLQSVSSESSVDDAGITIPRGPPPILPRGPQPRPPSTSPPRQVQRSPSVESVVILSVHIAEGASRTATRRRRRRRRRSASPMMALPVTVDAEPGHVRTRRRRRRRRRSASRMVESPVTDEADPEPSRTWRRRRRHANPNTPSPVTAVPEPGHVPEPVPRPGPLANHVPDVAASASDDVPAAFVPASATVERDSNDFHRLVRQGWKIEGDCPGNQVMFSWPHPRPPGMPQFAPSR